MSKSLKLIVEALLFASDKPLTFKEIQNCIPDVKIADIKGAIEVLQYEYDSMQRSFTLKEVAGGFQFRSHSEYGQYILKMLQTSPARLSHAALETLAIIAYKQPIIRQEIERLRGVDSGGVLKMLLEKDLTKIMGRKDLPGRPLIYGTTKKFLEVFDLKDIDSLPKLKEIKSFGADEEESRGNPEETIRFPEGDPAPGEEGKAASDSQPDISDQPAPNKIDMDSSTGLRDNSIQRSESSAADPSETDLIRSLEPSGVLHEDENSSSGSGSNSETPH